MSKTLHGRAHGKTIELDEDLGVPDGQEVRVTVEALHPPGPKVSLRLIAIGGPPETFGRRQWHGQETVPQRATRLAVARSGDRATT